MSAAPVTAETESESQPELTEEQQKELLDQAIERGDRIAESELEMARLFLENGRTEIARRRLQGIVERFPSSDAAREARRMLRAS